MSFPSRALRQRLRAWLAGLACPPGEAEFAVEACTGWRYVAEELSRAGMRVRLAEPADTAALRGRKKRAKTDQADSRLLRVHAAAGDLPECWVPPSTATTSVAR
jgi:transposase